MQGNFGNSGANRFAGSYQPEQKKGRPWYCLSSGSSDKEEADGIMRDFYRQVDKTDHKIREQDQQVTALEAATVHLLERQASTHKRVQALADGITKQDELQAKQVGKRVVPLQTNLPH